VWGNRNYLLEDCVLNLNGLLSRGEAGCGRGTGEARFEAIKIENRRAVNVGILLQLKQNVLLHPCVIHSATFVSGHPKERWRHVNATVPEVRCQNVTDEPRFGWPLADYVHPGHYEVFPEVGIA
jgi:hypothetical protein